MKIYYGLTNEEVKEKMVIYTGKKEFEHKGVNTSLNGLKKFIKDNKMESIIKYYTILDSSIFNIDNSILFEEKYDMIAVKIPFEFEITNINKLF